MAYFSIESDDERIEIDPEKFGGDSDAVLVQSHLASAVAFERLMQKETVFWADYAAIQSKAAGILGIEIYDVIARIREIRDTLRSYATSVHIYISNVQDGHPTSDEESEAYERGRQFFPCAMERHELRGKDAYRYSEEYDRIKSALDDAIKSIVRIVGNQFGY